MNMPHLFIPVLVELVTAIYAEFIKKVAVELGLVIDDVTARMLARNAVVVVGTSGGKDSDALGLLMNKFLNAIGHMGERRLFHADLGEIEHKESIAQVYLLGRHINWEVVVVRRKKGGLLERYEQRQADNTKRYTDLSCVTVISPWPGKKMPFCRGETKVQPITQGATTMFPGQEIVNAVGLRREESDDRAKKPISQPNDNLSRRGCSGRDYFPILDLLVEQVWLIHRQEGLPGHAAYDERGNERVSCSFCFLASDNDIRAGLRDEHNHRAYIRLCKLEVISGFSYRSSKWLCDEAPELLPEEIRALIPAAKEKAARRRLIEKRIPKELLFENHGGRNAWPKFQPSLEQCEIIASVRREIGELYGIELKCTTAQEVYDRYAELLAIREEKETRKAKQAERAEARRARGRTVKRMGSRSKKRRITVASKVHGEEHDIPPSVLVASAASLYQPSLF